jgi:oxygen-independent coproporphyrinogen-3 oxidase
MTGVYIHIPFCRKKCAYCDFPSFPGRQDAFEAYKDAVTTEINQARDLLEGGVDTVFFGGGTPTVLPAGYLCHILNALEKYLDASPEVTTEANPCTVDFEYLKTIRDNGFNRISFGMQTWQNNLLKILGRPHDREQFLAAYDNAVKAGFGNINIDLMFSLPYQSRDDWRETLRNAIRLAPSHISAYALTIEEGTVFYEKQREFTFPDDETDRAMYHEACEALAGHGYTHYEISNFATPGSECRHNLKYWRRNNCVGFGLSSHSFVNETRWRNTRDLDEYIRNPGARYDVCHLEENEADAETMFLGLRLNEGLSDSRLIRQYADVIAKNVESGLLEKENDHIRLTKYGRDVSNRVFAEFL